MSNPFSAFNHPTTITRKNITEGYYNTSGVWVAQTEASTTFSGHVSSVLDKELRFLPESVREAGVRVLSVDGSAVSLKNGDKLTITEPDASTTSWYVVQERSTTSVMKNIGVNRRKYYISLTKN